MREVAITAIGADRPGIVAAVAEVLFDLGCNLADCSMNLLRDQFAMILLVQLPDAVSTEQLDAALRVPSERLGLLTQAREIAHREAAQPAKAFVVSLYGADRPGLVYRVAQALADKNINITDLISHLADGVYTMILDIDIPAGVDPQSISSQLKEIAQELNVDLTFRAGESDEL